MIFIILIKKNSNRDNSRICSNTLCLLIGTMELYQEWRKGGSNVPKMKSPKDNTRKRRSAVVEERDKLKLLHMTSVRETTFSSIDFSAINNITKNVASWYCIDKLNHICRVSDTTEVRI